MAIDLTVRGNVGTGPQIERFDHGKGAIALAPVVPFESPLVALVIRMILRIRSPGWSGQWRGG